MLNKQNWTDCAKLTTDGCFPILIYRQFLEDHNISLSDIRDNQSAQNFTEANSKDKSMFNGSDVSSSNISKDGDPGNCFEQCNVINTMEGSSSCYSLTTLVILSCFISIGSCIAGCCVTYLFLNREKWKKRKWICCAQIFKRRKHTLDIIKENWTVEETTVTDRPVSVQSDTISVEKPQIHEVENKYETIRHSGVENNDRPIYRGSSHLYLGIKDLEQTIYENLEDVGYIDMNKYKIRESNSVAITDADLDGESELAPALHAMPESDEEDEDGDYIEASREMIYMNSQENIDKFPESDPLIYANV